MKVLTLKNNFENFSPLEGRVFAILASFQNSTIFRNSSLFFLKPRQLFKTVLAIKKVFLNLSHPRETDPHGKENLDCLFCLH